MRWLLPLVAACSLPPFAGAADGPSGHDEDNDGIVDVADPCPHIAGGTDDRDHDGVGDACDPAPDDPGDLLYFYSLETIPVGLVATGGLQQVVADSVDIDGYASEVVLWVPATLSRVRIEIGFQILSTNPDMTYDELTLRTMHDPTAPVIDADNCYYGQANTAYLEARELNDNASDNNVPLPGTIVGSAGRLVVTQHDTYYLCTVDGGGIGPASVTLATLPTLTMGEAGITALGVDVRLDFLFVAGR